MLQLQRPEDVPSPMLTSLPTVELSALPAFITPTSTNANSIPSLALCNNPAEHAPARQQQQPLPSQPEANVPAAPSPAEPQLPLNTILSSVTAMLCARSTSHEGLENIRNNYYASLCNLYDSADPKKTVEPKRKRTTRPGATPKSVPPSKRPRISTDNSKQTTEAPNTPPLERENRSSDLGLTMPSPTTTPVKPTLPDTSIRASMPRLNGALPTTTIPPTKACTPKISSLTIPLPPSAHFPPATSMPSHINGNAFPSYSERSACAPATNTPTLPATFAARVFPVGTTWQQFNDTPLAGTHRAASVWSSPTPTMSPFQPALPLHSTPLSSLAPSNPTPLYINRPHASMHPTAPRPVGVSLPATSRPAGVYPLSSDQTPPPYAHSAGYLAAYSNIAPLPRESRPQWSSGMLPFVPAATSVQHLRAPPLFTDAESLRSFYSAASPRPPTAAISPQPHYSSAVPHPSGAPLVLPTATLQPQTPAVYYAEPLRNSRLGNSTALVVVPSRAMPASEPLPPFVPPANALYYPAAAVPSYPVMNTNNSNNLPQHSQVGAPAQPSLTTCEAVPGKDPNYLPLVALLSQRPTPLGLKPPDPNTIFY